MGFWGIVCVRECLGEYVMGRFRFLCSKNKVVCYLVIVFCFGLIVFDNSVVFIIVEFREFVESDFN